MPRGLSCVESAESDPAYSPSFTGDLAYLADANANRPQPESFLPRLFTSKAPLGHLSGVCGGRTPV